MIFNGVVFFYPSLMMTSQYPIPSPSLHTSNLKLVCAHGSARSSPLLLHIYTLLCVTLIAHPSVQCVYLLRLGTGVPRATEVAQALPASPIYDTKYALAPYYTSLCASQLPLHTQHTEKKTDQKSVQKLAAVQNILLSIDSTQEQQKEEQGKTAPVAGDTDKQAIDVDRDPPPGSSRTSRQKTKAKLDDHRRKQDRERNYRKKTRELLEMETSLLQVCLAPVPPPSGVWPQTSPRDPPLCAHHHFYQQQ